MDATATSSLQRIGRDVMQETSMRFMWHDICTTNCFSGALETNRQRLVECPVPSVLVRTIDGDGTGGDIVSDLGGCD